VFYHLLDHYLQIETTDWPARFHEAIDQLNAQALRKAEASHAALHPERGPSLPLASYAGIYRDPWYGKMTIRTRQKGLEISFDETPGMHGVLEHVQYDTFRTRWADRDIEDSFVTFSLDPVGSIASISMQAVSPTADFSFDYQDLHFVRER
jgi:hypothetical protein